MLNILSGVRQNQLWGFTLKLSHSTPLSACSLKRIVPGPASSTFVDLRALGFKLTDSV